MTLTKSDIVRSVMEKVLFKSRQKNPQKFLFPEMDITRLSKKRSAEIVDTVIGQIKDKLSKGEDVRIAGFGNFQVKFKWPRKGRNPKTGETIILKSRRIVTFRASQKLRKKMNLPME